MKKIIILLLLFSPAFLYAQGNLQFNQVLNYEILIVIPPFGGGINISDSIIITIPSGRILKVESINATGFNGNLSVFLNDVPIWSDTNYPIWLPSGTHKFKHRFYCPTCSINGTTSYKALLSAIEFNIIP